jgi:hypothetical protein
MKDTYSSADWLSITMEAYAQSQGDGRRMASLIVERLGTGNGVVGAFAMGVSELASYAMGETQQGATVLEEEREAVEASRRIVRPVLQARLQRRVEQLDRETIGAARCLKCGCTAQSQGLRERTWQSLVGVLGLKRRYAYCQSCGCGVAPAQRALGLGWGRFTASVEQAVTMIATTVPHQMACDLASKLCGVELSKKALEDMTERRAQGVLLLQHNEAEQHAAYDDKGLPQPIEPRPAQTVAPSQTPHVAYLEMDGVVPITREALGAQELTLAQREGLQRAAQEHARGGKGRRYHIVGKEVKNAVLYTEADCVKESAQRGCILKKTYVSFLGSWSVFAARVWVELLRLRLDQAGLLVILSDGADWIRSFAQWLPFQTLLILDLFHVKHRIWEVANALHGERTAEASVWAHAQCDRVEAGQALMVIDALRFADATRVETRKKVDDLKGYLRNNLDRMHYPAYRARGLRISSAAIESANFHVTGQRLKCQGMRWTEQGARHMAALRADLFNGIWEQRTRELLAA